MKPMMTLLIMAAGMGSRYGGLKQLESIQGKTLLEYAAIDAKNAGFKRCVCVIQPSMQAVFEKQIVPHMPLETLLVHQTVEPPRKKPWGTGHAVLVAKAVVCGPCMVINADDYYGTQAFHLVANFFSKNTIESCLVGYRLKNTLSPYGAVSRGLCQVDRHSHLQSIVEKTGVQQVGDSIILASGGESLEPEATVSMNCWGFCSDFFEFLDEAFSHFLVSARQDLQAEFYLSTVVNAWLQQSKNPIYVLPTDESWCGITYQEDRKQLEAFLQKRLKSS